MRRRLLGVIFAMMGCRGDGPPTKLKLGGDCRNNEINAFFCATTETRSPDHVFVGLRGDHVEVVLGDHLESTTASLRPAAGGASAKSISVADKLGALTIAQLLGGAPVDFGLALTVAASHRGPTTVPVPASQLGWSIVDMLSRVAEGPLTFAGEPATPPAQHTLLWSTHEDHIVFGPAKTLAEIDWVAVTTRGPEHDVGVCNYNAGPDHAGFEVKAVGSDVTVTIYERKTGKVVGKQEFKAAATCPETTVSGTELEATVDPAQPRAWIAEQAGAQKT